MSARLASFKTRIRDNRKSRNSSDLIKNLRRDVHLFVRKVAAQVGKPRVLLRQFLLIRGQGVEAALEFIPVFNWTQFTARIELADSPSVLLFFTLWYAHESLLIHAPLRARFFSCSA